MLALICWVEPGHCNMRFQVHQFSWSFNSCKAELLSPFHGEQAQGRGKTSRAGALGRHLDKGRLPELLPKAAQPPDPGLLNFLSWLLSTLSVHFLTHRFMLLSRDLMLRKWILQVGSAPPSALTSPAHPPMRLASKWLGSSSPCPGHAMLLPGSLPMPVSVQTCISPVTKDEEHSMCQNSICVIFNIIIFTLITIVIPLSGLALCLGLFLCILMMKTCAM